MFNESNPICHDCDSAVAETGHAANCEQITSEIGRPVVRTSRLSPEGAPKNSSTWRTPRRRASAVVTRKLRKNGVDIDRRFKPVVS